ncbi:hypothetical protein ACEQ8H_003435 [Pleosporales sp. CAS-2024a]
MAQAIRQAVWDAHVAQSNHYDKIIVQDLDVVVHAGKDVWGRQKAQRALISVAVTLGQRFASASATDTVDASTIHYGILSKAIQARLQACNAEWMSTAGLSALVGDSVAEVAGSTSIYAIETDVCYVKGSMFGDGCGHSTSTLVGTDTRSSVLYLRNVRIPCVIGVNSNERLQKQPVVVNLWVECLPALASRADDYPALEAFLFSQLSASEFQTLESMLEWTIQQLRAHFFTTDGDEDLVLRLRMEKPLAVPSAAAAAVEITRPVRRS